MSATAAAPAYRIDGQPVVARALLRRRLRSARAASSSRPAPARARPGCWCRACCARCSTAQSRTRSSRSPSRARRRARCARASTNGCATSPRRDCSDEQRALELRARGLGEAAGATRWHPRSRACTSVCCAAGRPVEIRTFHAWFSQLLRAAPLEVLAELGLQPDDGADRGPRATTASGASALPCRRAGRRRACATTTRAGAATRPLAAAQVARRALGQAHRDRARRCGRHAGGQRAAAAGTGRSTPRSRTRRSACDRLAAASAELRRARRRSARRRQLPTSRARLLERRAGASGRRERFEAARAALFTQKGRRASSSRAPACRDCVDAALHDLRRACAQQAAHEEHLRMVRLRARCSASSPPTSARAASPTWPTWNVARSRCCATRRCPAGCRSGSTRAFAMC